MGPTLPPHTSSPRGVAAQPRNEQSADTALLLRSPRAAMSTFNHEVVSPFVSPRAAVERAPPYAWLPHAPYSRGPVTVAGHGISAIALIPHHPHAPPAVPSPPSTTRTRRPAGGRASIKASRGCSTRVGLDAAEEMESESDRWRQSTEAPNGGGGEADSPTPFDGCTMSSRLHRHAHPAGATKLAGVVGCRSQAQAVETTTSGRWSRTTEG